MKFFKRLFWASIIIVALFLFNKILNLTYYNPAVIIPAYGWLNKYKLVKQAEIAVKLVEKEELYPLIPISRLQSNLFQRPRARVIGTVSSIIKAPDGDWHINITDDSGLTQITEMVPEYPLPLPKTGAKIKIWGVTRYDLEHRWRELHPVFGWEPIK